jgi:hypothetical protein
MIEVPPFAQAGDKLFVQTVSLIAGCQGKPGSLTFGIEKVYGTGKRAGNQSVVLVYVLADNVF